jgi:Ni/Co efflux regulator RcnB
MNNNYKTTSRAAVAVLTALAMGASGLAMAQDDRDHRGGPPHGDRGNERGGDRGGDHGRPPGPPPRDRGPGAGPDHNFYKGGRLPANYRGREYVVDDWRGHHLSAPPRGYQWVQVGGDYVMVAVATGIIASLLLNR